eukprot:GDKI01000425.1.p1 GENE.GDKI01000425.1~~GDKI01000425.1.p1  ORF type:complete len:118 (+),score=24.61 GDKI01000425.1:32-355(+)
MLAGHALNTQHPTHTHMSDLAQRDALLVLLLSAVVAVLVRGDGFKIRLWVCNLLAVPIAIARVVAVVVLSDLGEVGGGVSNLLAVAVVELAALGRPVLALLVARHAC